MRENNRHKCPVDGCNEQLPFSILMCPDHWRQVPRLLKARVMDAWKNRAKNWQEYMDARAAAIAAVNGKVVQA